MFNYWAKPEHTLDLAKYLNDHIAQVVTENPKRFIGKKTIVDVSQTKPSFVALGTLPMQAPELAAQELRRCISELGLKGVQIGSHVNDWNLDAVCLLLIEFVKLVLIIY
jgi:aminocarboxymuconate-semialdehyde decarboxylase